MGLIETNHAVLGTKHEGLEKMFDATMESVCNLSKAVTDLLVKQEALLVKVAAICAVASIFGTVILTVVVKGWFK